MKKYLPWLIVAAAAVWFFFFRKTTLPATAYGANGAGAGAAPGGTASSTNPLTLLFGGGSAAGRAPIDSSLYDAFAKSAAQLFNQVTGLDGNGGVIGLAKGIFSSGTKQPGPGNIISQDSGGQVTVTDLGTGSGFQNTSDTGPAGAGVTGGDIIGSGGSYGGSYNGSGYYTSDFGGDSFNTYGGSSIDFGNTDFSGFSSYGGGGSGGAVDVNSFNTGDFNPSSDFGNLA